MDRVRSFAESVAQGGEKKAGLGKSGLRWKILYAFFLFVLHVAAVRRRGGDFDRLARQDGIERRGDITGRLAGIGCPGIVVYATIVDERSRLIDDVHVRSGFRVVQVPDLA